MRTLLNKISQHVRPREVVLPERPVEPLSTTRPHSWVWSPAEKMGHIERYAAAAGLSLNWYSSNLGNMLVLDRPELPGIDPRRIATYLAWHSFFEEKLGITNNCYDIALDACKAGIGHVAVEAHGGTSAFASHEDHSVFVDFQSDGSALAVDLTANPNVPVGCAVLGLRAETLDVACAQLGELYGGDWDIWTARRDGAFFVRRGSPLNYDLTRTPEGPAETGPWLLPSSSAS